MSSSPHAPPHAPLASLARIAVCPSPDSTHCGRAWRCRTGEVHCSYPAPRATLSACASSSLGAGSGTYAPRRARLFALAFPSSRVTSYLTHALTARLSRTLAQHGDTLAHLAAESGHADCLRIILEGADREARNSVRRALRLKRTTAADHAADHSCGPQQHSGLSTHCALCFAVRVGAPAPSVLARARRVRQASYRQRSREGGEESGRVVSSAPCRSERLA